MNANKRRSPRAEARFNAQWIDMNGPVKCETHSLSNTGTRVVFPPGIGIAPGSVGVISLGLPTGRAEIDATIVWVQGSLGVSSAGIQFLGSEDGVRENVEKVVSHLLPDPE
jgi:hypothetical protein